MIMIQQLRNPLLAILPLLLCCRAVSSDVSRNSPFVENIKATNYSGAAIPVEFWTTPNADWSNYQISVFRPLLVRFSRDGLIDFTPRMYVVDGSRNPMHCYTEGQTTLRENCREHCLNDGRYCENQSVLGPHGQMVSGDKVVEESLRRTCVWELYGTEDPEIYFDYLDEMKHSRCDRSMTPECLQAVYQAIGLPNNGDPSDIDNCMSGPGVGPLGQDVNKENLALADMVARSNKVHEARTVYPFMSVDGVILHGVTLAPTLALQAICGSFPEGDTPKICTFCAEFCPGSADYNLDQCLRELQCGNGDTFGDWDSGKVTQEVGGGTLEPLPVTSSENQAKINEQKNKPKQEWVAIGYVDESGVPHAYEGQTLPPRPKVTQTPTNEQDKKASFIIDLGSYSTSGFLIVGLAGGASVVLLLAVVFLVRSRRTRRMIKEYLREQEELTLAREMQGEDGYRDDDGNDDDDDDYEGFGGLDPDLEPAMQYNDYIGNGSMRAAAPPSGHAPPSVSFLPKIV